MKKADKGSEKEESKVLREIVGITLAVISIFLLVALFSFDPADAPSTSRYESGHKTGNACGSAGAYISFFLFTGIGVLSSYSLALLIGIWGGLAIARVTMRKLRFKVIGVVVFVLALATIERMVLHEGVFTGRVTGGYIGIFFAKELTTYLGVTGALLIVLGILGISLLLATELMFYDIIRQILSKSRTLARGAGAAASAAVEATGAAVRSIPVKVQPDPQWEEVLEAEVEEEVEKKKEKPKKKKKEKKKKEKKKKEKKPPAQEKTPLPEPPKEEGGYSLPPLELLAESEGSVEENAQVVQSRTATIEKTLESFNIAAHVVEIEKGPVITMYEIALPPGIKAAKIAGLTQDLAMALRAPSVRIVYPIPGKSTVGIEIPNTNRAVVRLKELLQSKTKARKQSMPLFLGRDAAGAPIVSDLATMPHLLIAGATGAGKSVCINSIITSILYTRTPDDVKLILVDPKIVELSLFEDLPHLLHPVVTDMGKAAGVLEWAMQKMDERYETLQLLQVRNIRDYNRLSHEERERRLAALSEEEREALQEKLPYIVIVVDELADLMMAGSKAVESSITRLAQKSRAVGIHLVIATQRPSVDVVTGLIKANLPSRIAFHVSSKIDSRTILDRNGAEALLMRGDMLYLKPGASALVRAQGTYIDETETVNIVAFLKNQAKPEFNEELLKWRPEGKGALAVDDGKPPQERDELYNNAVEIILSTGRGSVSLLQRKLGIGYGRASRLVDIMEAYGVVGPEQGSKPRECLMTLAQWHAQQENAPA